MGFVAVRKLSERVMLESTTRRAPITHWSVPDLLRRSFAPLFCLYVYLLILLPSGTILGINVKVLCFGFLLLPTLDHLLQDETITLRHMSALLLLPAILGIWVLLAQLYDFELRLTFYQYKDIFVTLISSWAAAVYIRGSDSARIRFLQMMLHAEMTACVLKIGILTYCVSRGIGVSSVIYSINATMGVSLMSVDFESSFGRVQFVADEVIPICLYILLVSRVRLRISLPSALGMFVALTISLIFTFSRYYWAVGVVALVLGMIVGKKDRFHAYLAVTIGLLIALSAPFLIAIIQLRFSMDLAGGSDITRSRQTVVLKRFFFDAPLLGHGLGSYTRELVRSSDAAYNYEVQIIALAGQEGIVGLLLMGLMTVYYYRSLWPWDRFRKPHRVGSKLTLLLLLLAYLAGGFFNPSLFNSAAAMSYAAIKALADGNKDLQAGEAA